MMLNANRGALEAMILISLPSTTRNMVLDDLRTPVMEEEEGEVGEVGLRKLSLASMMVHYKPPRPRPIRISRVRSCRWRRDGKVSTKSLASTAAIQISPGGQHIS